jgi:hypothetical protein cdiviTM7_01829
VWLLAVVLFGGALSLQPSISLAMLDFPSLRIGLYQVVVIGVIGCGLGIMVRQRLRPRGRWWWLGIGMLAITSVVGLLLSYVRARTALYTASLLLLLITAVCAALIYRALSTSDRRRLMTIGLWSGIVFGILAVLQLIFAHVEPTAFGTLCSGCHAGVFGFVRINLFAAEPQFLASSLLPALFVGLCWRERRRLAGWSVFGSSVAISLTFSRGAFIAIIGAGIVYGIVRWWQRCRSGSRSIDTVEPIRRDTWRQLGIITAGFVIGCTLLLVSAAVRYHNTPHIAYNTAVSMLDQLSLGRIKLPQKNTIPTPGSTPSPQAPPTNETTAPQSSPSPPTTQPNPLAPSANFQPSGFVVASADDRLNAAQLALRAWASSPRTILFGTGLGNLGSFIQHQLHQPVSTDHTVYIFYILLLSNIGVVGMIPLLALLVVTLWRSGQCSSKPWGQFALLLTAAIAIHFWFFGSLINSVHCLAWIGIFLYNHPKGHEEEL